MRNPLRLISLLLILAVLPLLAAAVSAEETAVSELNTDCTVSEDGSCEVVLQAELRLAPDTEEFSVPVCPEASDITVTGASFRTEPGEKYTRVILTGLSGGTLRVTVRYAVPETVRASDGSQAFTLQLLYPGWACAIRRYSVTVRMPKPVDELPTLESGYYGDHIDNYMEIRVMDREIRMKLNEKQVLQDHEAMTLTLQLDEDFFDLRFLAGKTAKVDKLLFAMFLILTLAYWAVFLRNLPVRAKRQAMPPEGGSAGEIPYLLTRQRPDLPLLVIHWATLGYLTVHRTRKGRLWLIRQIDMGSERKSIEGEVFRCLFARSDLCDIRSAEYGKAEKLFTDRVKSYWQSRTFSDRADSTVILRLLAVAAGIALCVCCWDLYLPARSWRWTAIVPLSCCGGAACWFSQRLGGVLLRRHSLRTAVLAAAGLAFLLLTGSWGGCGKLMAVCVVLQLLVGFALRLGGKRTRSGTAQASELLGFRRWLLSSPSEVLLERLQTDPQYFYKILPYADALRVCRFFVGGFDRAKLEPCDWLEWEGKSMKTAAGFYNRYLRLMAGLRNEREPLRLRLRRPAQSVSNRGR